MRLFALVDIHWNNSDSSQRDLTISCGWITLLETYVRLKGYIFCIREKDWYIDNKSDDKESVLLFFAEKLSTLLSLITGDLGKRCKGGGEGRLNKWNERKIIEISRYVGNVALRTFSYND